MHLYERDAEAVFNVVEKTVANKTSCLLQSLLNLFLSNESKGRITTAKEFGNLTFRVLALCQSEFEIPPNERLAVENESASKPFRAAIRALSVRLIKQIFHVSHYPTDAAAQFL